MTASDGWERTRTSGVRKDEGTFEGREKSLMEPGVQHVFEAIVAEMVKLCPWMTEEDVGWWREVLLCHFRLVALEEVDLLSMAGALLALAEHARAGGDARRAWAFEQWYAWACASMRGEEYHWPELPHELEAMP